MNVVYRRCKPFLFGLAATAVATCIARRYFSGHETMAICALVAFGLTSYMNEILAYNQKVIWAKELLPRFANQKLALELAGIFLGIFAFAIATDIVFGLKEQFARDQLYKNTFSTLFAHNVKVLIIAAALAALYRASGIVLVLCWNALWWAKSLATYLLTASVKGGIGWGALLGVGLFPHLFFEVLAYTFAGMSGMFISKAVTKYSLQSSEFKQVSKACVILLGIAFVMLVLSVLLEIHIGQQVFHSIL